jgi:copper transport protein
MTPAEPAGAHANQIRSLPLPDSELEESPNRVIVWFSEEIEASLSQVRVLDELAREVDNGDSAISPTESTALIATLPVLENGTYTVVWKNLSTVDGHRVVGSFRFAVGEPLSEGAGISVESQPLIQSAADPWLRWLFFAGALALVGTLTFDMFVVRPLLGSKDQQLSADLVFSLQRVMFRLMIAATALMVVGMLALLVQQAAITFDTTPFGVFGDPLSSVLDSEWGRLWLWRGLAVVVTGMLVVLTGRSVLSQQYLEEDEGEEPDADEDEIEEDSDVAFTESVFGGLALAGGLVVLGLTSFSSHNAAVPLEFRTVATISDFLHLLSSSVWIGGLLLIALATPLVLRASDGQDRSNELVLLLERFSPLAIVSAGALIVTGIFSGYMQVTVPAATNTPYGWTLVTKLLLLVPLFGLASVNSYLISKKLLRSGRFSFRRLVRYEAAVAVLVLVAVGWLAGLEPARQYAARNGIGVAENVTFSDFTEGANIDVAITPGDVGTNDVAITLTDRRGAPITNSSDVRVRLKFLEDDLGEPLISLGDRGDGVWVGSDFNITIGGVYQAEVRVIRPDAFDAITSHRFDAAPVSAAADAIRPTRTVAWTLFAFEIIAIGLLLVLVATPLLRGRVISIRPMIVPGAAFSVIGVALLLNAQVVQVGFPEERFNPFPVNAESIQLGGVSYAETCSACHGVTGLGDGPQSGGLSSPPADLSVHVPLHADSDLFGFIRDGIPGTAMPGQAGNLSEDEMWHLVNFLRTFEE